MSAIKSAVEKVKRNWEDLKAKHSPQAQVAAAEPESFSFHKWRSRSTVSTQINTYTELRSLDYLLVALVVALIVQGVAAWVIFEFVIVDKAVGSPEVIVLFSLLGAVALATCIVAKILTNYHVTLEANELKVGFDHSCLSKTILIDDIQSVEEWVIKRRRWCTVGFWHKGCCCSKLGIIAGWGPGVKVTQTNGRRIYFACHNPGKLMDLINKKIGRGFSNSL